MRSGADGAVLLSLNALVPVVLVDNRAVLLLDSFDDDAAAVAVAVTELHTKRKPNSSNSIDVLAILNFEI
jgi:hypothetical protein